MPRPMLSARTSLEGLLEEHGDRDTFISAVTVSELRHGVHRARDAAIRARRAAFVRHVLDHTAVLPIDDEFGRDPGLAVVPFRVALGCRQADRSSPPAVAGGTPTL